MAFFLRFAEQKDFRRTNETGFWSVTRPERNAPIDHVISEFVLVYDQHLVIQRLRCTRLGESSMANYLSHLDTIPGFEIRVRFIRRERH
jgi:hypothetical protein